jgi:hypothetical protein
MATVGGYCQWMAENVKVIYSNNTGEPDVR